MNTSDKYLIRFDGQWFVFLSAGLYDISEGNSFNIELKKSPSHWNACETKKAAKVTWDLLPIPLQAACRILRLRFVFEEV